MTGYYDYVLGLIPLTLFGLTGGLVQTSLSLTQAVPIAAAVAAVIVGHALFVRAPVNATSTSEAVDTGSSITLQNAD
ncbi:hypothetical protein [Halobellus rufus]|uniref:hypothetical protein n=1 Tax=Halobellus rufus TaxID=1448860 RepID=UPI0006787E36|nr:hypothetical protein [Halobellus rufus]